MSSYISDGRRSAADVVVCECRITAADALEVLGLQDRELGPELAPVLQGVLAAAGVIEDAMCDAGLEALGLVVREVVTAHKARAICRLPIGQHLDVRRAAVEGDGE